MSKIITLSQFFYGTTVTISNRSIDFDEGGPELRATLRVGVYSATEYAAEVQRAIREAGTQAYLTAYNRTTGLLSISAPLNFTLRRGTGTRIGTSAWVMMGYGLGSNLTGSNGYIGTSQMGSRYRCQYPVSEYTDPTHNIIKESANVNSTPVGIAQQVSFGDGIRITMNIRLITNRTGTKNSPFVENVSGITDFMTFIKFAMTKGRVEFMPDIALPGSFQKCYLESTQDDKDGRKFVLKNMNDPEYYQSGMLTFRKVLV